MAGSGTCAFSRRYLQPGPAPGTRVCLPQPLKGCRVTSVVSLRTFANSSSVPIVVFVDMQQEYLAKPRLFAISEIDRALDNCRKVLDHSRRLGLPVAFIQTLSQSASHALELEDVSADEIHRAASKISGLYGEVYETTDWTASTLPGKRGNRKNAGG